MTESQRKAAAEMVAATKGRIENLTSEQVDSEVDAEDVLLIDIREEDERVQNGVIPNSVSAPGGILEFWGPHKHLPSGRVRPRPADYPLLHFRGRSALATDNLQKTGYGDVAHLDGCIKAWKEGGHPVEEARSS